MAAHGEPLPGGSSQGTEHAPQGPTTDSLVKSSGNGDPNVDDQEVTFPRGGGWEPRG